MTKKIFASMLSVSVAVILMCVLSISYVLYGHFGNIIKMNSSLKPALFPMEL